MADEVTPIVETVPIETPVEPVVADETVTPVVETPAPVEAPIEPTPAPVEAVPEPTLNSAEVESGTTAQTLNPTEVGSGPVGGNEPLSPVAESIAETVKPELQKPTEASPNSAKVESGTVPPSVQVAPRSGMRELLVKAQSVIQFRKRKKLDKVMGLFAKRTSVTNDDVEKLLHVSDATATRYLSILEKEGKIKQTGKTGKGVLYTKI